MLITTELVRDILCNEVIELDKCAKATSCSISKDMRDHLCNLVNILMDDKSFVHVPVDAWIPDLTDIAKSVVDSKEHPCQ